MKHAERWMLWSAAAVLLIALPRPGLADDLPEPLKPFAELAQKCQQWNNRPRDLQWKITYEADFSKEPEQWATRDARVQVIDGKSELVVQAPEGGSAFVPIGPRVNGEFAIEMVARADGELAIPLSIMLSAQRSGGLGFQFSTRPTGRHLLWTITGAREDKSEGFRSIDLGTEPKLVLKQNYRIRLQVIRDQVTAFVDGKQFAQAPIVDGYDWNKLRQPHAMTVIDRMVVTSYRIEQLVSRPLTADTARDQKLWASIFGPDTTAAQIQNQAAALVEMLDDDSWLVREAAMSLVRDVGPFALPALKAATQTGSAEIQWRAQALLQSIPPDTPADATDPTSPPPESSR